MANLTENKQSARTPVEPDEPDGSRRNFLNTATVGLAGLCGLGLAAGVGRAVIPDIDDAGPRQFVVGTLPDFKINTVTPLRDRDLFLVRGEAGIAAVSARCTHLGCTVRRTETGFACPCHGALFGHRGEIISGPQRRPLPWYAVTVVEPGGRLMVDLEVEVEPLDGLENTAGTAS